MTRTMYPARKILNVLSIYAHDHYGNNKYPEFFKKTVEYFTYMDKYTGRIVLENTLMKVLSNSDTNVSRFVNMFNLPYDLTDTLAKNICKVAIDILYPKVNFNIELRFLDKFDRRINRFASMYPSHWDAGLLRRKYMFRDYVMENLDTVTTASKLSLLDNLNAFEKYCFTNTLYLNAYEFNKVYDKSFLLGLPILDKWGYPVNLIKK